MTAAGHGHVPWYLCACLCHRYPGTPHSALGDAMPKLRNMLGETGTIEIECPGDEPLVVEYRRGAVTPRLQGKLAEIQREIAAGRRGRRAERRRPAHALRALRPDDRTRGT